MEPEWLMACSLCYRAQPCSSGGTCLCGITFQGSADCFHCTAGLYGALCQHACHCVDANTERCVDGVNGAGQCICLAGYHGARCDMPCPPSPPPLSPSPPPPSPLGCTNPQELNYQSPAVVRLRHRRGLKTKCYSIDASISDSYCAGNCNHNPPHCPPAFCECTAATLPLPPPSTPPPTAPISPSVPPSLPPPQQPPPWGPSLPPPLP